MSLLRLARSNNSQQYLPNKDDGTGAREFHVRHSAMDLLGGLRFMRSNERYGHVTAARMRGFWAICLAKSVRCGGCGQAFPTPANT
jgi:hypothetical protein